MADSSGSEPEREPPHHPGAPPEPASDAPLTHVERPNVHPWAPKEGARSFTLKRLRPDGASESCEVWDPTTGLYVRHHPCPMPAEAILGTWGSGTYRATYHTESGKVCGQPGPFTLSHPGAPEKPARAQPPAGLPAPPAPPTSDPGDDDDDLDDDDDDDDDDLGDDLGDDGVYEVPPLDDDAELTDEELAMLEAVASTPRRRAPEPRTAEPRAERPARPASPYTSFAQQQQKQPTPPRPRPRPRPPEGRKPLPPMPDGGDPRSFFEWFFYWQGESKREADERVRAYREEIERQREQERDYWERIRRDEHDRHERALRDADARHRRSLEVERETRASSHTSAELRRLRERLEELEGDDSEPARSEVGEILAALKEALPMILAARAKKEGA